MKYSNSLKYMNAFPAAPTRADISSKRAAELCAYYSQARGGEKIPVDYCERRFVKKPSKAKAGFVVYTDYKTALVGGNNGAGID